MSPDLRPDDVAPDSPDDLLHDVRVVRDRIARELASHLSDAEISRVAETAHTILGMTINERAALMVVLRDEQRPVEPTVPAELWPDVPGETRERPSR